MQLMSTVFSILSLLVNKIGPEIKILNGIFNFNIKKNKMMMKIHSLKDFTIINFQRKSKETIFSSNQEIINHRKDFKDQYIYNKKSILKDKNDKDESILPITIINNRYEETSPNNQEKRKKISKDNLRISLVMNKSKSNTNKNKSICSQHKLYLDEPEIEKKEKELIESIHFNLFDYYCLRKLSSKKKEIELFNKGSSLYRRRMDIINVFTLLLLTEKKLLNNEKIRNKVREMENPNSPK